jgi:hypothetical protein
MLKETENLVIGREVAPPKDLLVFFERIGTVNNFPLQKIEEKHMFLQERQQLIF